MHDPRYQRGGFAPPVGMADNEGESTLVYRVGFGWVERRVEAEPVEPIEAECEGAA